MSLKLENATVSNQAEETLSEIYYWLKKMWENKKWKKEDADKLVEIFLLLVVNTQKIDEEKDKYILNLLLPSMVQINEEEIIIFGGFIINKNLYNYDNLCVNIRNGKNIKRGKNDIPGYGVYPPYLVDEDSFFIFFGGGDFPPNFAKICLRIKEI